MERYNFKTVEKKWQDFWIEKKTFKSEVNHKLKQYLRESLLVERS